MRGLSRRTFAGMLAAAPGSALPAPRAPAIIGPPWAPPAWKGWRQLGAGGSTISAPCVAYDGLLHLFVRGLDSGIYYSVTNANFENTWSPWREIPGGGRTPSGPAVTEWTGYPDGITFVVFVRDESNGIQYNPYNDENDTWWGWREVPGRGLTPSAPAVEIVDGPLLVVRDTNDGIQYNRLNLVNDSLDGSSWSGWSEIPGGGRTPSAPAIGFGYTDPGGRPGGDFPVSVVVRGLDDRIYENVHDEINSTWSGWSEVPGGGLTPSGPAVLSTYTAHPPLVVRGLDGGIYYDLRSAGPPPRRGAPLWTEIPGGARTPSAPAAVDADKERRRYVFIRGIDNLIYFNSYQY